MPLDVYKSEDPFENHPLFKTEEQARLEETMDGASRPSPRRPVARRGDGDGRERRRPATHSELEDSLWGRESRDFDWGD